MPHIDQQGRFVSDSDASHRSAGGASYLAAMPHIGQQGCWRPLSPHRGCPELWDAISNEALEGALKGTSALTAGDLRAPAARVSEIDPDDFVAELTELAVDEPYDGASSPDEDSE